MQSFDGASCDIFVDSITTRCLLQRIHDGSLDVFEVVHGLVSGNDFAVAVNEEFGEIPADVGCLVVGIGLAHDAVQLAHGVRLVEAIKAVLTFQPCVERNLVLAVHFHLLVLGELGAVVLLAELHRLGIRFGRLAAELVAGEVEYIEAQIGVLFIQALKVGILRRESALAGCVHHQNDLSAILVEGHVLIVVRYGCEVVQCLVPHIVADKTSCHRPASCEGNHPCGNFCFHFVLNYGSSGKVTTFLLIFIYIERIFSLYCLIIGKNEAESRFYCSPFSHYIMSVYCLYIHLSFPKDEHLSLSFFHSKCWFIRFVFCIFAASP